LYICVAGDVNDQFWILDAGTVDELEKIVEENFSAIKNTGREAEKFSGQPCLPEHLQVTCQRRF